MPREFGAVGDGVANDTGAIIAALSHCRRTGAAIDLGGRTYLLDASDGQSANFAVPGLIMRDGILRFSGLGRAFVADAAQPDGYYVAGLRIENLIIEGSSGITDGFYSRGIVRSSFRNIEVRNVAGKAFHIKHGVSNQYDSLKYTTNDGAHANRPTHGLYIDNNGRGHYTADCAFINPVIEGFSGIGCEIADGSGNVFVGGTVEGIVGRGLVIGPASRRNRFDSLWFEQNTINDIEVHGPSNEFSNLFAGSLSSELNIQVIGDGNMFTGGSLRAVHLRPGSAHSLFIGCGLSGHSTLGFVGSGTFKRVACRTLDANQNLTGVFPDVD